MASCRRSDSLAFHDTEGREFSGHMDKESVSGLILADSPEQSSHFELRHKGRFIAVCPSQSTLPGSVVAQCRVLICQNDAQCPPAHGLARGTCVNGLCIEPSQIRSDWRRQPREILRPLFPLRLCRVKPVLL